MKKVSKALKVLRIQKFCFEDNTTVEFFPLKNMPGIPFRVVINGLAKDWLGENFRPCRKTAIFFYEKHVRDGTLPPKAAPQQGGRHA